MPKMRISLLSRDCATGQLARFGVVGAIGFVVDSLALYAGLWLGLGFYAGRFISYLTAATATWALNRAFTFSSGRTERRHRQWARFLLLNSFGGMLNYGVYAVLIVWGEPFRSYPVLAVAVGSIAGMMLNFWLSRSFVFAAAK